MAELTNATDDPRLYGRLFPHIETTPVEADVLPDGTRRGGPRPNEHQLHWLVRTRQAPPKGLLVTTAPDGKTPILVKPPKPRGVYHRVQSPTHGSREFFTPSREEAVKMFFATVAPHLLEPDFKDQLAEESRHLRVRKFVRK